MEQKDYILREIEKIGLVLNAIRQKIFGKNENLSITFESKMADLKGILLEDLNFDLDVFLKLTTNESNEYLSQFKGFSIENIEILAETITEIALNDKTQNSNKYLEKVLQLYEVCNLIDRTYSLKREENIKMIKKVL